MGEIEGLQSVLDRFVSGTYTQADIEALKRFHLAGKIVLSPGERSIAASGDVSDSVIISGDRNVVIKGDGAIIIQQMMREAPEVSVTTASNRWFQNNKLAVAILIAGLAAFMIYISFPLIFTSMPPDNKTPAAESELCGGQSIPVTIPAGPGEFDRQSGYTFYNTTNSRGLALNAIRSLLADDEGIWVGYGATSANGSSGISHIGFDLSGYRQWEYCLSTQGKPIGHGSNSIAKAKDGSLWVATDDKGLINSRLPPASAVVTDFRVTGVPLSLRPGQTFAPAVTMTLEKGYELTQGDFLQSLEDNSYTSNPLIGLPPGITVQGDQSYTFSFGNNPMKAPDQTGKFSSTWRLWQCGRYVGPSIPIEFTVSNP